MLNRHGPEVQTRRLCTSWLGVPIAMMQLKEASTFRGSMARDASKQQVKEPSPFLKAISGPSFLACRIMAVADRGWSG